MTGRMGCAGARRWVRTAMAALLLALAAVFAGCATDAGPDASAPDATTIIEPTPTTAVEQLLPTPSPTPAPVRTGVSDNRVLFGQSAAFEGPASQLGLNMRLGIEAAFHEINQKGGVNGRMLELTSRDDGYEPDKAVANTRDFISEGEVFALIGAVGTPTSRSATPVAADAGIPYIAPFTGAGFLRDTEQWDNIINLRASYGQETEAMVERLTTDLGIKHIAIVYQDDSFGRAGYNGAMAALESRGMEPSGIGLYPRNTLAVKEGLLDIQHNVKPEAVIVIGAYNPVGELIRWARHTGLEDTIFMTVSFVGSNALAEKLGPDPGAGLDADYANVYVTQVVPFPTDRSVDVAASYLDALTAYQKVLKEQAEERQARGEQAQGKQLLDEQVLGVDPGFVSFEGYLAGRLTAVGLERCGDDVHRECFLNQFRRAAPFDIDGFWLQYGIVDNQGSDAIFVTTIGDDGNYRPVDELPKASQ